MAIVDHEMFVYDGKRKKALPKAKWRFLARYEDGEEVWLSWQEADPLAALDDRLGFTLRRVWHQGTWPGANLRVAGLPYV